jgi:hypothetical protein
MQVAASTIGAVMDEPGRARSITAPFGTGRPIRPAI